MCSFLVLRAIVSAVVFKVERLKRSVLPINHNTAPKQRTLGIDSRIVHVRTTGIRTAANLQAKVSLALVGTVGHAGLGVEVTLHDRLELQLCVEEGSVDLVAVAKQNAGTLDVSGFCSMAGSQLFFS